MALTGEGRWSPDDDRLISRSTGVGVGVCVESEVVGEAGWVITDRLRGSDGFDCRGFLSCVWVTTGSTTISRSADTQIPMPAGRCVVVSQKLLDGVYSFSRNEMKCRNALRHSFSRCIR